VASRFAAPLSKRTFPEATLKSPPELNLFPSFGRLASRQDVKSWIEVSVAQRTQSDARGASTHPHV